MGMVTNNYVVLLEALDHCVKMGLERYSGIGCVTWRSQMIDGARKDPRQDWSGGSDDDIGCHPTSSSGYCCRAFSKGSTYGWWRPKKDKGGYGISLWKGITKGWDNFERGIMMIPVEGSLVSLGHDKWLGTQPLKDRYPDIYIVLLGIKGHGSLIILKVRKTL